MKRSLGSRLIIVPPASPRVHQVRITHAAIALILCGSLMAFAAAVTMGYVLPQPIPESERIRLRQENEKLRKENRNLEVQARRLDYRVSQIEEVSKRITEMMQEGD